MYMRYMELPLSEGTGVMDVTAGVKVAVTDAAGPTNENRKYPFAGAFKSSTFVSFPFLSKVRLNVHVSSRA